jgi:glycosyltransferase involved in cell wall biosynthesis
LNPVYSFIILTYNEAIHLPRLLNSIKDLDAETFILDSGSTDDTLKIAAEYGAQTKQHTFINHPQQWDHALKAFDITTPWVICLDADQIVTSALKQKLTNFNDQSMSGINGIYFNRKNYFKGKWIKHGSFYPFYLLKMLRFNKVHSDLNENMDHRFIVNGPTVIWKDGYLIEENLKENNIRFWIDKHNRYSDLVAIEEVERRRNLRSQTVKPQFFGTPDQRTAWLKRLWWKMPLFIRPFIYFTYRYIFRLGILDGSTGFIFHFLQAFWFRLLVDIKILELLKKEKNGES